MTTSIQTTDRPSTARADAPNRLLFAIGLLQVAAVFAPAVRIRILGTVAFLRLPTAGVVLLILALLQVAIAFRPVGWWKWIPSPLAGVVVAVSYRRIVTAPSGSFIDPLLRHAVHPAWGFILMSGAVALSFIGVAIPQRSQSIAGVRKSIDRSDI